ncbi:hypothetical protein OV079_37065 [Nannocystis pusilla]|uniref:Tetratricopeptide repeat protein n=1 Tax=Nannocystis pusilla TaxID=889268 RepID=A0A9X3J0Y9_9BACT|nr:hypothetical protein [Nannocystis pusilla]MCY1011081.1 hypothetical protein [Nannocystis pusilla]
MSLAPRLRLSASLTLALAAAVPGCLKVPVGDLDAPGGKEGNPAEAKAVIDRFIAALGGEEALRKIAQRTVEARMTFLPETGCTDKDENCRSTETVGTFTLQSTADQRLYRRTVIDKQIEEEGFDGKTGWQFRRGFLVLEDEDESVITREDAALHWYFDFDKRGISLALEKPRDKDFDGKARVLDGVRWSTKNDLVPPKTQWYDRATGLLAEELLEDDKAEPPISQHIIYDDYRPIDGVLVAHKIRLVNKFGDRTQEVVFVTQRVDHAPIKPEVFQVPKVPPPEKAKDEKLVALAKAREAAAAEPKNLDAQVSLARALWAASHFDEAADAAQVALKLQPKEAEALWILARARCCRAASRRPARCSTAPARRACATSSSTPSAPGSAATSAISRRSPTPSTTSARPTPSSPAATATSPASRCRSASRATAAPPSCRSPPRAPSPSSTSRSARRRCARWSTPARPTSSSTARSRPS